MLYDYLSSDIISTKTIYHRAGSACKSSRQSTLLHVESLY